MPTSPNSGREGQTGLLYHAMPCHGRQRRRRSCKTAWACVASRRAVGHTRRIMAPTQQSRDTPTTVHASTFPTRPGPCHHQCPIKARPAPWTAMAYWNAAPEGSLGLMRKLLDALGARALLVLGMPPARNPENGLLCFACFPLRYLLPCMMHVSSFAFLDVFSFSFCFLPASPLVA